MPSECKDQSHTSSLPVKLTQSSQAVRELFRQPIPDLTQSPHRNPFIVMPENNRPDYKETIGVVELNLRANVCQ